MSAWLGILKLFLALYLKQGAANLLKLNLSLWNSKVALDRTVTQHHWNEHVLWGKYILYEYDACVTSFVQDELILLSSVKEHFEILD